MCNLTSFSALKENKATIKNFWKVLSKVDLSDNDCAILFPNDYLFVSSEETKYLCGLYTGSSTRTAISGTNFVQVLQSGYVLASINEGEVGLFSPCGNLMKVFVYDKKQFSRVRLVKKEGVNHYISGYSFINKFFLRYNTLAARCANRCYLAKANGFDFNKLFYVGEYEEISEMKDSACGMVYVLYKDGTFKLFDKKFKLIDLPKSITRITFLENGNFIGFDHNGKACIYDTKAKLIAIQQYVKAAEYDRFYMVSDKKMFDCYTNKEYYSNKRPLIAGDNFEIVYENGAIWHKRFLSGPQDVETDILVVNCPTPPTVVDGKYLTFRDKNRMFVIDPFMTRGATICQLLDVIDNLKDDEDLSLKYFVYLKSLYEYLSGDKNILKKMLKNYLK